jgi:hypothetical protein
MNQSRRRTNDGEGEGGKEKKRLGVDLAFQIDM